jgi:hypothetical protein
MASANTGQLIQGGSVTLAPNGYLATILTTGASFPSPQVIQDVWSNARRRRYPRAWNEIEPVGHLVIYWTPDPPIRLICRRCRAGLGSYRAYQARGEYGIVQDTTRRYHPRENFPPDEFKNSPQDRLTPAQLRYWFAGNLARAATTIACFKCINCGHESERNFRRLGKQLFENRPSKHELD